MRRIILTLLGVALSTLPPMICALSYFPVWQSRGGAAVLSGFLLMLLLICFVPLFRTIKYLLSSPAAHTMWFISFILFFALSKIADEMTVISFVGFIGNLLGAFSFRMARLGEEKNEK